MKKNTKEKPARTSVAFSRRLNEMIEQLQDALGYLTKNDVIQAGVVELYNDTFPKYRSGRVLPGDTPEVRVRRKEMEKKEKLNIIRDEQILVCETLEGEVIQKNGNDACQYYTYTGKKRFEQVVPLTMLTTDMVKTQYQPSKDRVLKLQAEGKVEY